MLYPSLPKIKKDRNRACVQNVHTFLNRRGIIVEMEKLKVVMDDLILRNIVEDKGKGKESFFVVDSPSVDEEKSYIVCLIIKKGKKELLQQFRSQNF